MPEYGSPSYWDERYAKEDTTFDWYLSYNRVKHLMQSFLKTTSKILMVGCGNSRMSEQMYEDGFNDITNIDISEVVIEQMKKKYAGYENMKFLAMDVKKLSFPKDSFDVIIDKGTMDAILCGNNSFHNAATMNGELSRVLVEGGHYVNISYGQPSTRLEFLRRPELYWSVEVKTVDVDDSGVEDGSSLYYVYIMTRQPKGIEFAVESSAASEFLEEEEEKEEELVKTKGDEPENEASTTTSTST